MSFLLFYLAMFHLVDDYARCAALTAYNALHGPVPIKGGDVVLLLGTGGVSM